MYKTSVGPWFGRSQPTRHEPFCKINGDGKIVCPYVTFASGFRWLSSRLSVMTLSINRIVSLMSKACINVHSMACINVHSMACINVHSATLRCCLSHLLCPSSHRNADSRPYSCDCLSTTILSIISLYCCATPLYRLQEDRSDNNATSMNKHTRRKLY